MVVYNIASVKPTFCSPERLRYASFATSFTTQGGYGMRMGLHDLPICHKQSMIKQ